MKRKVTLLVLAVLIVGICTWSALGVMAESAPTCDHTDHAGWSAWTESASLPSESGMYYLTGSVTLSGTHRFDSGVDITLCLNGQTVTASDNIRLITVADGATVTVCDCQTEQGKLCLPDSLELNTSAQFGEETPAEAEIEAGEGKEVLWVGNATLNLYGGTVSGGKPASGGGVVVQNGGVFNMYGGTITENRVTTQGSAVWVAGTFNLCGGTITGNSGGGSAVYLYNKGAEKTLNMSGGIISGNTLDTPGEGTAGAVCIPSGCVFNFSGGSITNHQTRGIYLGGRLNMSGTATVSDNTAPETEGAGIRVSNSGQVQMTGGSVEHNTADTAGGGILSYGAVTVTGGRVSDNVAGTTGGGIQISNADLVIGKDASVTGNRANAGNSGGGGIMLFNGNAQIDGEVSGNYANMGAGIYFSAPGEVVTLTFSGKLNGNVATTKGGAVYIFNNAKFVMTGGEIRGNQVTVSADNNGGAGLYLTHNSESLTPEAEITGGKLWENENASNGGSAIYMLTGSQCSLRDCEITGNVCKRNSAYSGAVYSNNVANKLTVSGKVNIHGNTIKAGGVEKEGGITLQNSSATNPAKLTVGLLDPDAKLTVTTPAAANNVVDASKMVLPDGDTLNGVLWGDRYYCIRYTNTDQAVVWNGSAFTFASGHPDHCSCGSISGDCGHNLGEITWEPVSAVEDLQLTGTHYYYLTANLAVPSTRIFNSGANVTICLNGFTLSAGANVRPLRVNSGATLTLCDCQKTGAVTKNNTTFTGGGALMYINAGTVNIYNITLKDSVEGGNNGGGAILAQASAHLNMTGVTVTGCSAPTAGGALGIMSNSVAVLDRCVITGNQVSTNAGSAIRVNYGTLTLRDCTVTNNTSDSAGVDFIAAVYVMASATAPGNLIVEGNTVFAGNTNKNGRETDIYLQNGLNSSGTVTDRATYLKLGELGEKARLGVLQTMQQKDVNDFLQVSGTPTLQVLKHSHNDPILTYRNGDAPVGYEDGAFFTWTAISGDQNTLRNTSGHYYLTEDVSVAGYSNVTTGENITLCLNGKEAATNAYFYRVGNQNANVTVCSCSDDYGKLHGGTDTFGGGFMVATGTLNLENVELYGCKGNQTGGKVGDGFSGGAIHVRTANGAVHIQNSYLHDNDAQERDGGAVCIRDSAELTASNTVFENNTGVTGGAIFATVAKKITLEGCTFNNNTTKGENGGAIAAYTVTELTLTGCEMTGNAGKNGGAVYANKTALTATDTQISGCSATRYGGAIYADATSALTARDITVTGNTAGAAEDILYGGNGIYTQTAVTLSGKVICDDLGLSNTGSASLKVGALTEGSSVAVKPKGTMTAGTDALLGETLPECTGIGNMIFYLASPTMKAEVKDGNIVFAVPATLVAGNATVTDRIYITVADAVKDCSENGYIMKLTENIADADLTVTAGDLIMDLNGHTLDGSITFENGTKLYGFDSATDSYTGSTGKLTATIDDEAVGKIYQNPANKKRYVAVKDDDNSWTFNRFYVGMKSITADINSGDIGYKAIVGGNDTVQSVMAENAFGFKIWVEGYEDNTRELALSREEFYTGIEKKLVVKNQLAAIQELYAEDPTYTGAAKELADRKVKAQVFIRFSDGTVVTSATYEYSIVEMYKTLDGAFATQTESRKAKLHALLDKFPVMTRWDLTNTAGYTPADETAQ